MWIVDPETREPLPAFEPADRSLRRICGDVSWPGEHDDYWPGHERSTMDDCGFQYVRPCRRSCCAGRPEAETP